MNPRLRTRWVEVCLLAAALSAACQDASSDPVALILADDTWSVLASDGHLPSLGALVAETGSQGALAESAARWSSSWELPLASGHAVRSSLYDQASAPLAQALGNGGVAAHVEALGEVLSAATELEAEPVGEVGASLQAAAQWHQGAVAALAEGRDADALRQTLQASDMIRELGPEGVARMLLARAEGELTRLGGDAAVRADPASPELMRGQRLIRGAQQALDERDYMRAIQRAFYACQVLGLGRPS